MEKFQKEGEFVPSKARIDLEMKFLDEAKADMDRQLEVLRTLRAEETLKASLSQHRGINGVTASSSTSTHPSFLPVAMHAMRTGITPTHPQILPTQPQILSRTFVPHAGHTLGVKASIPQSLLVGRSSDYDGASSDCHTSPLLGRTLFAPTSMVTPSQLQSADEMSFGSRSALPPGRVHFSECSTLKQPTRSRTQASLLKISACPIVGDRIGERSETGGVQRSRASSWDNVSVTPSFSSPLNNATRGSFAGIEDDDNDDDTDEFVELQRGDEVIDRMTSRRSTVLFAKDTEVFLKMEDGSQMWRSKTALEKVPKLNLASAGMLTQERLSMHDERPPLHKRGSRLTAQRSDCWR